MKFKKLSFIIFTASAVAACDGQSQQSAQNTNSKADTQNQTNATYSLQATKDDWPKLDEQSEVAENLLASNFYIIFDGSGSMSDIKCSGSTSKLNVAKDAVVKFVKNIPSDANVGLYAFDIKGSSERVSIGKNAQDAVIQNVHKIIAKGGTPLATSVYDGYNSLLTQAKKQLGYGEYNLVIVTDGLASDNQSPSRYIREIIQASPIVVHTVGFCIGENHSLNQPGLTIYKSANNPQSLQEGLDSALAESPDFNLNSFQ